MKRAMPRQVKIDVDMSEVEQALDMPGGPDIRI
jgi:hypothetical protein